jgi:hypothetical protein
MLYIFWESRASKMMESRKSFRSQIDDLLVEDGLDEEKLFLPEGCFSRLVTEARVRELLPSASRTLVKFVCNEARKIFLTLMWDTYVSRVPETEVVSVIEQFQKHRLTDRFLPIEDLTGKCKAQAFSRRRRGVQKDEKRECTHDVALNVFHDESWEYSEFRRFRQTQWTFSAPVFRKNEFKQELCAGTILPFTSASKAPRNGHFSKVFAATLHADHQDEFVIVRHKCGLSERCASDYALENW